MKQPLVLSLAAHFTSVNKSETVIDGQQFHQYQQNQQLSTSISFLTYKT
jgi:hypothetical protein